MDHLNAVTKVGDDSEAEGKLLPGDLVTAVNGQVRVRARARAGARIQDQALTPTPTPTLTLARRWAAARRCSLPSRSSSCRRALTLTLTLP